MGSLFLSNFSLGIPPPLGRPLSRDKADTLLLLLACALVLVPHMAHLPIWISVTFPFVLFWRGWTTFRGNRMPPRWLLLPISMLAMGGVYWTHKAIFERDAGVSMLVLLISFKLLEMHARRDLFVVIFLNFFLILANFFYSQSIGIAVMMVIAIIATLTAQLSFQYTALVPSLKQRLRLGSLIFALAAPLTIVFFIFFPRIQGPFWDMPEDANSGRTGMSNTMAPGNIAHLALSDEIAFRVKFIDPVPARSKLYWRGIVLGKYDGKTWTQLPMNRSATQPLTIHVKGKPVRHQVTLEPNDHRWLFALELPQRAPWLNNTSSGITPDLEFLSSQPINERIRYETASYTDFILQENASALYLRDWLLLPPHTNPRTTEFASKLQAQFSTKVRQLNAVLHFFRSEKFIYTLEPPPLGKNAVDDFLFLTRAGFCEHYASSFVVLMRALDIPARVVTGYQGGEINAVDGFMTVRQSDAHAWAEVWLEHRGWIRVDPTAAVAPDRIEMNLTRALPDHTFVGLLNLDLSNASWIKRFGFSWDAANNSWNQWILNYNTTKQKNFLLSLGFSHVNWSTLAILMLTVGTVVVAIVSVPLVMNRQKIDPLDGLYSIFCGKMAALGYARLIHEGPQTYAARLSASLTSPLRENASEFLKTYSNYRYEKLDHHSAAVAFSKLKKLCSYHR